MHFKSYSYQNIIAAIAILSVLAACKDTEDAKNESEHEAITTVELLFSKNGSPVDSFYYDDPDGDGGNPPIRMDSIVLDTQTTYIVSIRLYNKTKNPVADVTNTILEQATSHEIFLLSSSAELQITRTDRDASGYPLGLTSLWRTLSYANASVRLKLMHKPLLKGPNDDSNKGHSDVDITFPILIQ